MAAAVILAVLALWVALSVLAIATYRVLESLWDYWWGVE